MVTDVKKGVPSALVKAKRHSDAKKASYLRRRNKGRVRTLKAQKRTALKIKYIKDNLSRDKNVNGYWVP